MGGLGCGVVMTVFGALSGQWIVTFAGGALAGAGLMILFTAGWVDPLGILVLSLPLPAMLETDAVRLAVAVPVTAAVILSWALSVGASQRPLFFEGVPWRSTTALVFVFVVATVFAPAPLMGAVETLNVGVILALAFVATDLLAARPGDGAKIARLIVLVAAVNGVLAVMVASGILPGTFERWGTSFNRAALGFGQPNSLGLFLAVCLPLAVGEIWTAETRGSRMLAWVGLIAISLGLVSTFSRGSWLAVLGGSGILLLLGEWRRFRNSWLAIIAFFVVVDIGTGGIFRTTIQLTLTDWVIEQRFALMLAGVVMFLDNPILGVGPGGFAANVERISAQVSQLWDLQPTPHNAFVQAAAESGVIGLVAFVVFLGAAVRSITRTVRARSRAGGLGVDRGLQTAASWALATAVMAGFVGWPLRHGTGQVMMIALALGLTAGMRTDSSRLVGRARAG